MREPTKRELLAEVVRLKAENERLTRLVATQRPELEGLRAIEVGLRNYIVNGAETLKNLHADLSAFLPGDDADLPGWAEMLGILSAGRARVESAARGPQKATR